LVAGFVYSQVLAACVTLGLFDTLAAGPERASALAPRLGLSEEQTLRLLKAAASLRLLQRLRDGRFALGPLGAALHGNKSVQAMIAHHAMLYRDLEDPVALLNKTAPESELHKFWAYNGQDNPSDAAVTAYSTLMAQSQALIADAVLSAFPLRPYQSLLDIGGGEGVFLAEAGRRWPHLGLKLFDLPAVVGRARTRLGEAGLAERTAFYCGNFLSDPLPVGLDAASLVRVLHDHDDLAAMTILQRARHCLAPKGILLIAEPMAGTRGAEPVGDAYFGFYLAAMGNGRPRTRDEIALMLQQAGFRSCREIPTRTPLIVRLIVAQS
jgi:demethylspheroidene O-methyltransferase